MNTYLQIGAGGTGTHLIAPILTYLSTYHGHRNEAWEYVVIDGDDFEQQNATRQLFDPGFATINKARAMAAMYNRYPVTGVPRFIGRDDLQTMMQDGATVLICADNHTIRALVAERAAELDHCVVINAGNEHTDGNVQIHVRVRGENKTPPITFLHPEIKVIGEDDRSAMSCQQVAALPGGGQTIVANMQAATWMLSALWRVHEGLWAVPGWTELQYDLVAGTVHHIDMRDRRGWR